MLRIFKKKNKNKPKTHTTAFFPHTQTVIKPRQIEKKCTTKKKVSNDNAHVVPAMLKFEI